MKPGLMTTLGGLLTLLGALGVGATMLAVPGCEDNDAEDVADDVGDAIDDAADEVEDAVD